MDLTWHSQTYSFSPRAWAFRSSTPTKQNSRLSKELEISATRLVNALRVFRLQRAILAVGMFSMFEALLQSKLNWTQPFSQLDDYLRAHDEPHLASALIDYRRAVNVLKHGEGRSHQELLARADKLEFKVRADGDHFQEEGDVSDVGILVDADDQFVHRCAELIKQASEAIRLPF